MGRPFNPVLAAWKLGLWLIILPIAITIGPVAVIVWVALAVVRIAVRKRQEWRRAARIAALQRQLNISPATGLFQWQEPDLKPYINQINRDVRDLTIQHGVPQIYLDDPSRGGLSIDEYWAAVHPGYDKEQW